MKCIEIVDVPKGPAPLEVRKAWVGLRLPLSQPFGEITDGRTIGTDGCAVDVVDAVEILGLYNKDAALWWRNNTGLVRPGATFVFDSASCRPFTGLPSITTPFGHAPGTKTVRDFLRELFAGGDPKGYELPKRISSIEQLCSSFVNPLTKVEQKELENSAVTRPIVLLLSNLVASDYSFRVGGASSEQYFEDVLKEGHTMLQAIYRLAVKCGIDVIEEEIDRPLSFTDIGIRAGIIERVEGGVKLTPKGEADARRVLSDDDDTPF